MMKIWEIYPALAAVVGQDHISFGMQGTGHDFDHALQAGQYALLIAEDQTVGRLAGAGGLCHNADRMVQHQLGSKKNIPEERVVAMVRGWLEASGEGFGENDSTRIVNAVLHHHEVNKPDDDSVLVALKDADRITCTTADNVMTSAQFWSELPAIDPRWLAHDPSAHSYRNPKSVLKNLECRYDWINPTSNVCVRLPKAKALMERRVAFIKRYIEEVEAQREEAGLWPDYPYNN